MAPPRQVETVAPAVDQPFAIDGRLSARRGSEGAAADFAWNHEYGRDRIDFASPFGQVYDVSTCTGETSDFGTPRYFRVLSIENDFSPPYLATCYPL